MNLPDPRLVPCNLVRLANLDYDAVFTGGGCFLFALRLYERFKYPLRGIRASDDPNRWSHVWVKHGTLGVDIRGCYREEIIAALASNNCQSVIHDLGDDEVSAEVDRKGYPQEVLETLCCLADRLFDLHERFELVRPPKA